MQSRIIRTVFPVVLFALVLIPTLLHAQTFRGGINGTVTDTQGAAIPNAKVEAVNDATAVVHSTSSSSAGEFSFQEIPLGVYTVTATASGFETYVVKKVQVSAGSIYTLAIKLPVASTATTVEVSASALSLDTTTTTQTTVIGATEVSDIPLNGRDFTQMIVLTPGFSNSGAGGFGAMNGTRANQMNWQIDGIDNNDLWHNIPAVNQGGVSGIAGIILPLDAVEQFSAQTQASPESGRNPGGTINLSLKSGTNQFHGSAYYFNRNEFFGAKSPFTPTKAKVRDYNWGLSLGGPFIKDKLFGFMTFEKQRFVIGQSGKATEPSAAYQALATAALQSKGIAVNPVATSLLNTVWPSYALTGPATQNNYVSPIPEYGYSYNGLAKVDYTVNDRNSLSAHWFAGQGNQVAPAFGVSELPYYYEVAPIHVQNYALVFNHVFSASVANQLLAGVNYFNQVFDDNNTHFNVPATGLITNSPYSNAPNIRISGFDQTGATPPEGRNDITGHLTDDLSWTFGKHQLKLGGELRQAQLDEFYHRHANATFKFDGSQTNLNSGDTRVDALGDFLAGAVASSSVAIGDPERQVFVNTYAVFAQDSYQLTHKFNLNYGVRWDYEGPLHNGNKDLSVFRPSNGGILFQGAGVKSVYDPFYTAFSPRVGFSYQANAKTVVRAGSGLYFDTPNLNPFLDNRPGNNAPNGLEGNPAGPNPVFTVLRTAYTIQSGQPIFPSSAGNPCQVASGPDFVVSPCGVFSVAKNFRPSYNLNFNLQVEQSFGDKVVAQLGYVGSQGRHLLSIRDINQSALLTFGSPTTAEESYIQQSSRPYFNTFPTYGNINEIQSIGNSNYNSLQATLRLASWHGLTSQAAYTWAHSFDDVTAYRGALPQDSFNFKGDYGNSDFDARHTFVGLISYSVPGAAHLKALTNGWQANSLLTFHTGLPFSVFSSADSTGTDEGVQRANQIADPYAGAKQAKVGGNWLNPAAFVDAPAGTLGTSRRNAYYAPGFSDVDLSFFKNTHVTERINTQFRVEMFNLFNRTNFAPPLGAGSGFWNPNYTLNGSFQLADTIGDFNGAPGIGAGEAFNTQLGLKITF